MIYFVVGLFFVIKIKGWNSISKILFAILALTGVASYFVGRQVDMFNVDSVLCSVYTTLVLSILFLSFDKYSNIQGIDDSRISIPRLQTVEKILVVVGLIAFITNVYILFRIFPLLAAEQINVQEYKNEGGAYDVIDQFIPHIFVTFSNLVSAVGYFFLPLHFYYLYKRQTKKAVLFFVLSLIIVLSRLIGLSRSSSVEYILSYGIIFLFFGPLLSKRLLRKVSAVAIVFISILLFVLLAISESRFSTYYTKNSKSEAILDEQKQPVFFSAIDYFTQWEEWGEYILLRFEPSYMTYGAMGFGGIYNTIEQKLVGPKAKQIRDKKVEMIKGEGTSAFTGLVSDLVIDFGFIGTIIFVLIFNKLMKHLRPRSHLLSIKSLLFLPTAVIVISMFWAGSVMNYFSIEAGIIYNFVIYQYIKRRPVRKPATIQAVPSN